jgi:hypothetical protein
MGPSTPNPGARRSARRRRLQQNERRLWRMDLRFMVRPGPAPLGDARTGGRRHDPLTAAPR